MSITAAQASEVASPVPASAPLVPARDKRSIGPAQEGCAPPCCSLWTLNAIAAAVHGAWFVIFILLWRFDTREDGERRDITYPLWVSYATWGELPQPPIPPLLATAIDRLAADDLELSRFHSNAGYPTCEPPRSAKVGSMPVSPAAEDTGLVLSLHWLVVSFFALSFAFQFAAAVFDLAARARRRRHRRIVIGDTSADVARADDTNDSETRESVSAWLRFVEYGFSAAVMIVAIALQVGLMDAWMLFALATLTWATMMLGLAGERILAVERRIRRVVIGLEQRDGALDPEASGLEISVERSLPMARWVTHLTGWVTQGVVFVVIIAHFYQSQGTCEFDGTGEDNVAPDFVYAIVFCELGLFALFGLTQMCQFLSHDYGWCVDDDEMSIACCSVEAAYIVQSLVSKTLLGWLVYGGNFAPN